MSVASEINRIKANIAAAYTEAEAKGATMPVTENSDNLADTVASIPQGGQPIEEKAVNFYDYDGTVLYAYTAAEALALSELPQAPTHDGLTFQGWNRTLESLQSYVAKYNIGNAGATYITDDGVTRLYLEVGEDISLDYELYVQIANGTLTVEADGVELGSEAETSGSYVNYTIPFTLPSRGNVRVDLKFTGTGGFRIGQGDERTRIFGWNSDQNGSLVKVELGEYITNIGGYAFNVCTSLNSVVIPSSVTNIDGYAFRYCTSLNSVVIPSSVTNIDGYAFYGCTSLNNVVIPDSVTSIRSNAFQNCTSLNNVVIPDSVTSIVGSVFRSCISLNNVVIPDSVTSIGISAFYGCISLNNVVIPDSVTSIGGSVFNSCISLNNVVIPDSVTSIGSSVFNDCTLLLFFDLSQYTDPNNLPTFSNSSFLNGTPPDQIIYVANQEMLTAFSNAPNISVYSDRMVVKS